MPAAILGSFGSVADEIATLESGRNLKNVARYVLGVGLGVVVLVLLFGRRSELAAAWRQLGDVAFGWGLAAVGAEALSLGSFAYLQRRGLSLADASIPIGGLFLLRLAKYAITTTIPAMPPCSNT